MEIDIDKLSQSWRQIKAPTELEDKIIQKEKAVKKKNILGTVCLTATAVFIIWVATQYDFKTDIGIAGIVLIILDIFAALFMMWKKTVTTADERFNLSNVGFAEKVKQAQIHRKNMSKYFMPVYGLMLLAGINLYYYDLFLLANFNTRIMIHSVFTVVFGVMFFLLYKKQCGKIIKEADETIASLQSIQS